MADSKQAFLSKVEQFMRAIKVDRGQADALRAALGSYYDTRDGKFDFADLDDRTTTNLTRIDTEIDQLLDQFAMNPASKQGIKNFYPFKIS